MSSKEVVAKRQGGCAVFIVYAFLMVASSRGQDLSWSMHPPPLFPTNEWGAVTNACQLGLRLPKTQYELGEPIIAFLYLRNTGDDELAYITGGGLNSGYQILLEHANGEAVEPTEEWATIKGPLQPFSSRSETLAPHAQQPYPGWVKVNERYKIDRVGNYTITAKRRLDLSVKISSAPDKWKDAGRFEVLSNPVTITVVAPTIPKPEK